MQCKNESLENWPCKVATLADPNVHRKTADGDVFWYIQGQQHKMGAVSLDLRCLEQFSSEQMSQPIRLFPFQDLPLTSVYPCSSVLNLLWQETIVFKVQRTSLQNEMATLRSLNLNSAEQTRFRKHELKMWLQSPGVVKMYFCNFFIKFSVQLGELFLVSYRKPGAWRHFSGWSRH